MGWLDCSLSKSYAQSFDVSKKFVQVVNSLHSGVVEMLIIGTVRHQHQSRGVFRYIAAVLMPVIDKQLHSQFFNQLGLLVLREINHRVADPMFPEPIAGNSADIVGVPFIAMRDEDQFLLAAEPVQSLPLLG